MNDIDQLRDTVEDILAEDAYQVYYQDQRNIFQRIWDQIMDWINGWLSNLLGDLQPANSLADAIIVGMLVIGGILTLLLILFITRYLMRKRQLKRNQPLQSMAYQTKTLQDYIDQFEAEQQADDLQGAVRYRFLILLFRLEENEWLKVANWKTNWDYYKEIERIGREQADAFYQIAIYFESITYGNKRVELKAYQAYIKAIHHLEQGE
ncbi:DUF4129 domain-containing protein [Amphibacillus cookii]|uniref:DUF4129 domain-containing protein n=1 Tax=Amphibacillus cookii TaxID=767787 RepID=UPI001957D0A2|nr:DUF4129 domain-containing protein [Amphibacillus cookii]MBM7542082.1 hypothetical protein [Amphibacillus cookii]